MKCLYCDKDISDKAKYCSEAHRKAYQRRTQAGQIPNPDSQKPTRTWDFDLTRTDLAFEKNKPGYYNFTDELHKRKCMTCGKDFKTRLKLLNFCSPQHMEDALNGLAGIK